MASIKSPLQAQDNCGVTEGIIGNFLAPAYHRVPPESDSNGEIPLYSEEKYLTDERNYSQIEGTYVDNYEASNEVPEDMDDSGSNMVNYKQNTHARNTIYDEDIEDCQSNSTGNWQAIGG